MSAVDLQSRAVLRVVPAVETPEGDGARVRRGIGSPRLPMLDPFLLLDEFFVEPPAGFPPHPHRGFETVTYMLDGAFRHEDTAGHRGVIGPGGLQRMTAGRGVWHSEMPGTPGMNHGIQLWVNLPRALKDIPPDYQDVAAANVPEVVHGGARVRLLAGALGSAASPLRLQTPLLYLDVTLEPGEAGGCVLPIPPDMDGCVYVLRGRGAFGREAAEGEPGHVLVLGPGDRLAARSRTGVRFALLAGKPHREPVRRHGPFVD